MTVSHAIVILLILTCQLTPKSNSHISQSFVASVYKPAFFQCSSSPVSYTVQQCIQISTRINSSMYIVHISFVLLFRVILQGFVDPIMQQYRSLQLCWRIEMQHVRDIHKSRIPGCFSLPFGPILTMFTQCQCQCHITLPEQKTDTIPWAWHLWKLMACLQSASSRNTRDV